MLTNSSGKDGYGVCDGIWRTSAAVFLVIYVKGLYDFCDCDTGNIAYPRYCREFYSSSSGSLSDGDLFSFDFDF